MFEVDEFEHLRFVAAHFEQPRTESVRRQRCEAVAHDAVSCQAGQKVAAQRLIQFVLATRYREDRVRLPANCRRKGIVGRGVAGMQRHGQMNGPGGIEAGWLERFDAPDLEPQSLAPELLRNL